MHSRLRARMASTKELIETAVERFQEEVPALQKLKLIFGLELKAKHDIQLYRVELPGPKISKGFADDERVHVSIPRSHFNELAADGRIGQWHEAYDYGHIKIDGDPKIQQLIGQLIEHAEARGRLRKAR